MRRIAILLGAAACLAAPVGAPAAEPASQPATQPAASYPRIAMFWSLADSLDPPLEKPDNYARHAIIVEDLYDLGFRWTWHRYHAMVETLKPESFPQGRLSLAEIRRRNPAAIVLLEVFFFEEHAKGYPEDHPWWLRNKQGKRVRFWPGTWQCDLTRADYIGHVARRIEAVYQAAGGQAGIFLDNLRFDASSKASWTALLQEVRKRCGDDLVILVNAGWDSDDLEWIAPLVNGIQYEDAVHHTGKKDPEAFYTRIAKFDRLCRKPRCGVNEVYGKRDDAATRTRELLRTLVYTDLAYLYADSTQGHKHAWYELWNVRLGSPAGEPPAPKPATLARREFEHGTVLWLPGDAQSPAVVALGGPRVEAVSGKTVREVTLAPGSGALLLAAPASAPAAGNSP